MDGGANTSATAWFTQLWQRRFWFAATCRVTSVMKARPRWARNGRMSGSLRWKVFSTYWPWPESQTTAVSDRIRLDSDP